MLTKRLNEILARKSELTEELKTATAERLAEIKTESEGLIAEETELRSKIDLSGKLGKTEPKAKERNDDKQKKERKNL